jgi:hypothetical protein
MWIRQCVDTEDGIQVVAMTAEASCTLAWADARISCSFTRPRASTGVLLYVDWDVNIHGQKQAQAQNAVKVDSGM